MVAQEKRVMLIRMTTVPPPQPIDLSRLTSFGIPPKVVAELIRLSQVGQPKT